MLLTIPQIVENSTCCGHYHMLWTVNILSWGDPRGSKGGPSGVRMGCEGGGGGSEELVSGRDFCEMIWDDMW